MTVPAVLRRLERGEHHAAQRGVDVAVDLRRGMGVGEGLHGVDRPLGLGVAQLRARQEHVAHVVGVPPALGEIELVLRGAFPPRRRSGTSRRRSSSCACCRGQGRAARRPPRRSPSRTASRRRARASSTRSGRSGSTSRGRAAGRAPPATWGSSSAMARASSCRIEPRAASAFAACSALAACTTTRVPSRIRSASPGSGAGHALDGLGVAHRPHVQHRAARVDDAPRKQVRPGSPGQRVERAEKPHRVDDAVGRPAKEQDVDGEQLHAVQRDGAVHVAPAEAEHDGGADGQCRARSEVRPRHRPGRLGVEQGRGRRRAACRRRESVLHRPGQAIEVDFSRRRHASGGMVPRRRASRSRRFRPLRAAYPPLPATSRQRDPEYRFDAIGPEPYRSPRSRALITPGDRERTAMSPTAMLTLMFAAIRDVRVVREPALAAAPDRPAAPAASITSPPAPEARGGTRSARRKWTITTRRGWPTSSSSSGSSSCCCARSILWGRGFYPPFNLWRPRPATSRSGRPTSSRRTAWASLRRRRHARLLLLPPRRQAEAHGAQLEGLLIIGDHLHDDDRRHDLRRRVARPRRRRQAAFCDGRDPRRERGASARDRHRSSAPLRRRVRQGAWSVWPAPAGSLFATIFAGPLARDARLAGARRLLDARDAGRSSS